MWRKNTLENSLTTLFLLSLVSACAAAKKLPPPGWTLPSSAVDSVFTPTGRDLGNSIALHPTAPLIN